MSDVKYSMAEAQKELDEARTRYETIHAEYERLRGDECAAVNRLNKAQQAFDKAAADVRDRAPWNTDWHQSGGMRVQPMTAPTPKENLERAIEETPSLPRCVHGRALVDGSGEHLEPPCGCRAAPTPTPRDEETGRGGDSDTTPNAPGSACPGSVPQVAPAAPGVRRVVPVSSPPPTPREALEAVRARLAFLDWYFERFWDGPPDECEVQDRAEELGLLTVEPYDPATHTDATESCDPGDKFYQYDECAALPALERAVEDAARWQALKDTPTLLEKMGMLPDEHAALRARVAELEQENAEMRHWIGARQSERTEL